MPTSVSSTELIRPSRRALSQVLTCLLTSVSRPVPLTALAPGGRTMGECAWAEG